MSADPALTRLLSSALSLVVVLPLSLRPFSFLSYTVYLVHYTVNALFFPPKSKSNRSIRRGLWL